jgi:hypothetical protein
LAVDVGGELGVLGFDAERLVLLVGGAAGEGGNAQRLS